MSLSERLAAASGVKKRFCKIGVILSGTQLKDEDKKILSNYLDTPEGTPGRIANTAIAAALRAEGFDVSNSSVDRHRNGDCACVRVAN